MFGFLGLSPAAVTELKGWFFNPIRSTLWCWRNGSHNAEKYHIYMAQNSRVSIAGLNPENVEYVAVSIADVLKQGL